MLASRHIKRVFLQSMWRLRKATSRSQDLLRNIAGKCQCKHCKHQDTCFTYVLSGCPCGTSPLLYFLGEDAGSDFVNLPGDMDLVEFSPGPRGDFIPGGVSKTDNSSFLLIGNRHFLK